MFAVINNLEHRPKLVFKQLVMQDIPGHLAKAVTLYIIIIGDADMVMMKVVLFCKGYLYAEQRVICRYIPRWFIAAGQGAIESIYFDVRQKIINCNLVLFRKAFKLFREQLTKSNL